MNSATLSLLHCPDCSSKLSFREVFNTSADGDITCAVLACNCDEYPLLENIAFLKKNTPALLHRQAVALLRKRKVRQATILLFEERKKVKLVYTLLHIFNSLPLTKSYVTYPYFLRLLKFMNPESRDWITYLQHRDRRATFMLSLSTLAMLKRNTVLVDIGCGTGQFLAQAVKHVHLRLALGVDVSFSLLYLARLFSVPSSVALICADVEPGLPFKNKVLHQIAVNDAFMYFKNKIGFITEAARTLKADGIFLLTHVHRKNAHNLGQGMGINLTDVSTYQTVMNTYVNSDTQLFTEAMRKNTLTYFKVKFLKYKKDASYSLLLSKANKQKLSAKLPLTIKKHITQTTIDYTEDEHLQVLK
jgi:SAM-dependent methyltransferase